MSSGPQGSPPQPAPVSQGILGEPVLQDIRASPVQPGLRDIPVAPLAPAPPVPQDTLAAPPAQRPQDIPRRRALLVLLLAAAGYAALRLAMNREFAGAPWDELLAFTAPKPFGLRVLVPLLVWPLHSLLRVPTVWVFALVETLAATALVLAVHAALRPLLAPRLAATLSTATLALLPIPFLLQHRWPIYYPYDTPAMAFTAAGVALLLARRWRAAAVLVFFAALNRESAVLLPLAALALPVPGDSLRPRLLRALLLLSSFAAARLIVGLALLNNPGAPLQFFAAETPRLLLNLAWLEDPGHWPLLPAYLGFVPLLWVLLASWIPAELRRLGWVALLYIGALMWVANIDEPRVYGEPMILLYIPAAVGLARWLRTGARPL